MTQNFLLLINALCTSTTKKFSGCLSLMGRVPDLHSEQLQYTTSLTIDFILRSRLNYRTKNIYAVTPL